MYRIEMEVHRGWNGDEERLMVRVADAVCGRTDLEDKILRVAPVDRASDLVTISRENPWPQRQDDGFDWSLDGSNSWKASLDGSSLTVAYRYGGGHPEMMEGLRAFLAWSLA